jgi:uncharacterized membrane protein YdjX (TVP38/TMEM64 family)
LEPDKALVSRKVIALVLIIGAGIVMQQLGWFDWTRFLAQAQKHAHSWWLPVVLIAAKIVLYAFALPGSFLIWLSGLLYDPLPATVISMAGGVGGAAAAYAVCRRLSEEYTIRIEASRLFQFLHRHTDFAMLAALRSLPNFPHSVINYGAGIIGVPLPRFLLASTIGFAAKGYLYTTMISHAVDADHIADAIDLNTLGPLFILAALFLIGKFIQRSGRAAGPK